jgi:hypothetical protein
VFGLYHDLESVNVYINSVVKTSSQVAKSKQRFENITPGCDPGNAYLLRGRVVRGDSTTLWWSESSSSGSSSLPEDSA